MRGKGRGSEGEGGVRGRGKEGENAEKKEREGGRRVP